MCALETAETLGCWSMCTGALEKLSALELDPSTYHMARAQQKTMDNETRCGSGLRSQELQRQNPPREKVRWNYYPIAVAELQSQKNAFCPLQF